MLYKITEVITHRVVPVNEHHEITEVISHRVVMVTHLYEIA